MIANAVATLLTVAVSPHFEPDRLLEHIRVLASDDFGGRLPGTTGEEKTIDYLLTQCRKLKLQPGNLNGQFIQTVPLWGSRSEGKLQISGADHEIALKPGTDYVAWSALPDAQVQIPPSPLVFAGYGAVAPEYHWDDYAGAKVRGKIVLLIGGDPPVADPGDPTKLDEKMFLGPALSYHGRLGRKLERAFQHGAVGVIVLYSRKQSPGLFQNFSRENMILRGPEERKRVKAQALLSIDRAEELFIAAGQDFKSLREAAAKPGFRVVNLPAKASFDLRNSVRRIDSRNVIAKLPGSDRTLAKELVIYSAHWDHHGQEGDKVFHGASDNAAGMAGVLELARAFRALPKAPRRSILFFWPTAEEKGLLGARYYVEHPLYPRSRTLANLNLDYFSNWGWGRTRDFGIVGLGNSTLDDLAAEAVRRQGRVITGDTYPEQGFYFRSDHFEFARAGVPALETTPGIDYVDKPAEYGIKKRAEYIGNDYHQPSDVPKPDWDLSGAVEDLEVLFDVGYAVAQSDTRPAWKPDAIWRPPRN